MPDIPLGVLPPTDPLYGLLATHVLRETLGLTVFAPAFDVFALDGRGVIFRYSECHSGVELIGKFYGNRREAGQIIPPLRAAELVRREFANLRRARSLGLAAAPYRVVRPLVYAPQLNAVLVEEYVAGPSLDTYLKAALLDDEPAGLGHALAELATFLALLHARSRSCVPVTPAAGQTYLTKLIGQTAEAGVITPAQAHLLALLRDQWGAPLACGAPRRVLVHGDVTPVNIVFRPGEVVALDLERLREDDPAVDLGMVVGELYHACLRTLGDPAGALPLAAHFLDAYRAASGCLTTEDGGLERRIRFYLGTTLLRISRNGYLDLAYRQALSEEAYRWLADLGPVP